MACRPRHRSSREWSRCGAVGWTISRQIAELDRSQRELSDRVDRLLATLDAVTTAQQAHVTASPEQDPAQVSTLLGQIRSETEGLRPHVRSIDAGRALQAVAASVATLSDIEARAAEHLRLGQDLMAADLLASDGRSADEAVCYGASDSSWRGERRLSPPRGRVRSIPCGPSPEASRCCGFVGLILLDASALRCRS